MKSDMVAEGRRVLPIKYIDSLSINTVYQFFTEVQLAVRITEKCWILF